MMIIFFFITRVLFVTVVFVTKSIKTLSPVDSVVGVSIGNLVKTNNNTQQTIYANKFMYF